VAMVLVTWLRYSSCCNGSGSMEGLGGSFSLLAPYIHQLTPSKIMEKLPVPLFKLSVCPYRESNAVCQILWRLF